MTLKEEKLREYNNQKFSFSVERLHGGTDYIVLCKLWNF